jgi:hypothetical protein
MKPIGTLSLALVATLVGYPVSAADPPPSADSNPAATVKVRSGTKFLGMVLVDPSEQEMKQYQMESALPLVLQVEHPAFFPEGMEPTQGCAFWIIEPPANGFLFNQEYNAGRRCPKTVRELVQAIIACTASPEEYQKVWERAARAARERAESLQDKPEERERLLRVAEAKIPPDEVGKYICRVVYNYPGRRGTMTTTIRMAKDDLVQLRALLEK